THTPLSPTKGRKYLNQTLDGPPSIQQYHPIGCNLLDASVVSQLSRWSRTDVEFDESVWPHWWPGAQTSRLRDGRWGPSGGDGRGRVGRSHHHADQSDDRG